MNRVRFLGHVWPPAFPLSVALPSISFTDALLPSPVTFAVKVTKSELEIVCELSDFDEAKIDRLIARAYDVTYTAMDLVSFARGFGLRVLIEKIELPGRPIADLGSLNAVLQSECSAFQINDSSFGQMFHMVLGNHEIFMALRDLIDANTTPHMAAINCGRAIDGIRRLIAPSAPRPKDGWVAMQTALNISEDYQKWITDLSTKPRHANRALISGQDTSEGIRRTWAIMNRFLIYWRSGKTPLRDPEFPCLSR